MTSNQIDEKVILRIPKIPRVHWILFLLTVFTTLLAVAIMEGAQILDNPLGLELNFTPGPRFAEKVTHKSRYKYNNI